MKIKYRMWQVGWEDEAFDTTSDDDASCVSCFHDNGGAPHDELAFEGMIVFMAFHPIDEPEKVEVRAMTVVVNPCFPMFGQKFGWFCESVTIEDAKRRQPNENPRENN